ncbi:MAG: hypothetical protein RLZZ171_2770, partial [Cyanobacteriota bacterium]|jgi:hypothetical protein
LGKQALANERFLHRQIIAQSTQQEIKLFPDWSNLSLADLAPVFEGGEINPTVDRLVGWKASRSWQAGDRIQDIVKLGDLEQSLSPQLFSLEEIFNRVLNSPLNTNSTSQEPKSSSVPPEITLNDFNLIGNQSLGSLVKAIPSLALKTAKNVEPIADLLKQHGVDNLELKIGELIDNPKIANLRLNSIDLQQYQVDSIPGASSAQLKNFQNYESSYISEIPGLDKLTFSDYPNPIRTEISFVGRADVIWGEAESDRNRTISGSYIEGFQVPCRNNCAHIELDDIENLGRRISSGFEGNQWIRGRDHWVAGGTGCFSGGREPTGIHPFGSTFKEVLWDTDETSDRAQIVMYFNIKTQCGESPYFIGPFPFPLGLITVNDLIFLGSGK